MGREAKGWEGKGRGRDAEEEERREGTGRGRRGGREKRREMEQLTGRERRATEDQ